MTSLPSAVKVARLPLHLPNGMPVLAHDVELELVVQPDRLYVEMVANFNRINAGLLDNARFYKDLDLPEFDVGVQTVLQLQLVARPEVCAQFHKLFQSVDDPVGVFCAGPKPEGAKYSPILAFESYERTGYTTFGAADNDEGIDDELEDLLDDL